MLLVTEAITVPGGHTVRVKLLVALRLPSLTTMLMSALPLWPGAGVMVTMRLESLPPKTMFDTGISTGLDESLSSVSADGAVRSSPIMNASGPVLVLARMA